MRHLAYAAAAVALVLSSQTLTQQGLAHSSGQWITAWSTSHHTLGTTTINNATVRLIARVTISGDALRVRIANGFGTAPLHIGRASVGLRIQGAAVAANSSRSILFNSAAAATIPPGATITSDQVAMRIMAGQDVAISLYVPMIAVRPTQHTLAFTTSYASGENSGDLTSDESQSAFTATTTSMFWLKAIDVLTSSHRGSVVAFGDSITDGNCSTVDGHDRWLDWLAVRLALEDDRLGGRKLFKAVLNEGISGNTIGREKLEPPPESPPGLERLDRDVLSHHGVTDVILFMGTNDIRRQASAAQVIGGTESLLRRLKTHDLRVIGATIIPRHNNTTNSSWDARKTAIRNEVNRWMRERAPLDGIIDFDRVVRDPTDPDRIHQPFNCDEIHPTVRGHYEMGRSVPLELLQPPISASSFLRLSPPRAARGG
jgi:lysophospholipase L1-like esterase